MLPVTVLPSDLPAIGSVIWLHGLGASGDDFVPLVPHMQLPDVRFVFPHAPVRGITAHGGWEMPAWFDLSSLGHSPDREDPVHIAESSALIAEVIRSEVDQGIPSRSIVLAGFSQGAALALHIGHGFPEPLQGILVMSGYMLLPNLFKRKFHPANKTTPLLFCHGERDLVVPYRRGRAAYRKCRTLHAHVEWLDFPVGHELCLEELHRIRRWLHTRFAVVRAGEAPKS
jgi:phospholipase/carboxylesterase